MCLIIKFFPHCETVYKKLVFNSLSQDRKLLRKPSKVPQDQEFYGYVGSPILSFFNVYIIENFKHTEKYKE